MGDAAAVNGCVFISCMAEEKKCKYISLIDSNRNGREPERASGVSENDVRFPEWNWTNIELQFSRVAVFFGRYIVTREP